MKYLLALALALCCSCVMPGDLREIADAQERWQASVADTLDSKADSATVEAELEDASETFLGEVAKVSDRVEERTKGTLNDLEGLLKSGGVAGAAAFALNLYRNATREKRLQVERATGNGTGTAGTGVRVS